jgi:hypothetical protein
MPFICSVYESKSLRKIFFKFSDTDPEHLELYKLDCISLLLA